MESIMSKKRKQITTQIQTTDNIYQEGNKCITDSIENAAGQSPKDTGDDVMSLLAKWQPTMAGFITRTGR